MAADLKSYFGIDFGTTSSAVVGYMVMDNKPELFRFGDAEGRPVPSVVAINKETGDIITGREAWERKTELSETCEYFYSIKSILDKNNVVTIAGRDWTPVDIAAELLKKLKDSVKTRTGNELNMATVAIPIGFSPEKRDKLRTAANRAGVTIESFVSEPTAAFFANYEELKNASVIAVFDWGGGTLDVSILRNENGKISELATAGSNIAGDYIDNEIAHRIHSKVARKKGIAVAFEDMPVRARDMMRVKSEVAKRNLSDDESAVININNYGPCGAFNEILDYDWFAAIIDPVVTKAMGCLKEAIDQSGVGVANIDRILMVGGSSNLRPLLEKMGKEYGDKIYFPEQTMWNVGQGAAILSMTPGNYYANQSVGIILSDNAYYELLKPDTPLEDWEHNCSFGIVDAREEARFVFSGSPDINSSPEKYRTLSVPAYRFMQEHINLKAFVDQNMVLNVIAGSNMRPKEYYRIWQYSKLKCYYKLSDRQV